MNRWTFVTGTLLATLLSVSALSAADAGAGTGTLETRQPNDLRVFWKQGLNLENQDQSVKLKAGGRYMGDWTWVSTDNALRSNVGDQTSGTETRRARFYVSGQIHDNAVFKLQFDFAGGMAKLKDGYVGLNDTFCGGIRVGHFKEPFGLEELTSSKYITFIERSLPTESFSPSRNAGVMIFDTLCDHRATWAAGVFRPTDDYGHMQDNGGHSFTARVTGLPAYQDKGACLVHVGASASHRTHAYSSSLGDESARYRSRPEAHLLDRFVDTGSFKSERSQIVGLEAAVVQGPFSAQGEFVLTRADINSHATFSGFYGQVSYFLTGEHRAYKKSSGSFSRVKPKENYGRAGGGLGAWEVAARFSSVDLTDASVTGGELRNITAGVNWHLNPNMRMMANYIRADKKSVGEADIGIVRVQVDF
jgi:phosphate-selective porin OprO/OprP